MATIKPIEGRSVHQIQSGQVIVDLCSVVKELVENSLDAGATSIDVRFKNHGLDSIEVQDNGEGITPENFETIALKHYTSKLSTYDDLSSLQTFGFRGEALSSLCALSRFHVVTARASDGPKGTKLDFEISGKLRGTSVVASQKGTIVAVEDLFYNLPVRRRELEKNIKREYGKALGVLHAYACISTGVRFAVSNQMSKAQASCWQSSRQQHAYDLCRRKAVVFATKSNLTTRENIANVYGAKTLLALLPLDLQFQLQPSGLPSQSARIWSTQDDVRSRGVRILGHISRPVVGEGRQTPDRQMFFVNSRPCGLPQVAKAINEVYKSYNVTQSPFVLADLIMDTNAYDVNVSPDKRTILLHDQTALLESLKASLTGLFDAHDQSVPQAQASSHKLPAYRPLSIDHELATRQERMESIDEAMTEDRTVTEDDSEPTTSSGVEAGLAVLQKGTPISLIQKFVGRDTVERSKHTVAAPRKGNQGDKEVPERPIAETTELVEFDDGDGGDDFRSTAEIGQRNSFRARAVQDFNDRIASQEARRMLHRSSDLPAANVQGDIPAVKSTRQEGTPGMVQSAFDLMRPKRIPAETATITIGDTTAIMRIGTPESKRRRIHTPYSNLSGKDSSPPFGKSLRAFAAPGTQIDDGEADGDSADEGGTQATGDDATNTIKMTESPTSSEEMQDARNSARPPVVPRESSSLFVSEGEDSDKEYLDEGEKKAREEANVARMIAEAEEAAARPSEDNVKRATALLQSRIRRDSTLQLVQYLDTSVAEIRRNLDRLANAMQSYAWRGNTEGDTVDTPNPEDAAEERLSLSVSKADFARMRITGQFNLGFILATRAPSAAAYPCSTLDLNARPGTDELFIIDQHASDEKYNFERLQTETIVQNQRLVHPRLLELTAIEEEIILSHPEALAMNGFQIEVDTSGEAPVGKRCRLVSLPMSREVMFDVRDLEELLALLSEQAGSEVPRPSKVRRMFAMRACRSSTMVGKTLTVKQMQRILRHMGEIDKPWNCPHGRPTMRHLYGLDAWDGWSEGDGVAGSRLESNGGTDWEGYLKATESDGLLNESNTPDDADVEG